MTDPAATVYLGINYSGLHDSAVAAVRGDGTPVWAMSLERTTRVKQDSRWPRPLIDDVLGFECNVAGIGLPYQSADWQPDMTLHCDQLAWRRRSHSLPVSFAAYPPGYDRAIETLPRTPLRFDHHLAHAASAYYPSGLREALVLTYDAGAFTSPWLATVYLGQDGQLTQLAGLAVRDGRGIANLYTAITALLGLTPGRHEGKVTGLAAYEPLPAPRVDEFESLCDDVLDDLDDLLHWEDVLCASYPATLAVNRPLASDLRRHFGAFSDRQLAAAVQQTAERHIASILSSVRAEWPDLPRAVCLAGGLFANVRINQRIRQNGFERIFICPAMTDDGVALGAALLTARASQDELWPKPLEHVFLGSSFAPDESVSAVGAVGLRAERPADAAAAIARILADGRSVCVFEGAVEFGPRALGHRSILHQATDATVNDWLNARLRRTEYMPFAPVTRVEDADWCYRDVNGAIHATEFMTITLDCTDQMRAVCPAVVHVDGTARPQLVRHDVHPLLHAILTHYKQISGVPSLINTSFNMHESPIVRTPEEAIQGFAQSGLDVLYLDGLLIDRRHDGNATVLDDLARRLEPDTQRTALARRERDLRHAWAQAERQRTLARDRQIAIDWLEEQLARTTHSLADVSRVVDEQRAWIAEIEKARDWAESQRAKLEEEVGKIGEIQRWTEEQRASWQQKAADLERVVAEQQHWIGDLQDANTWLDQQRAAWQKTLERQALETQQTPDA